MKSAINKNCYVISETDINPLLIWLCLLTSVIRVTATRKSFSILISEDRKISLSTVKLDLKIFEQLGLIRLIKMQGFKKLRMTKFGKLVIHLLTNYKVAKERLDYLLFPKLAYLLSFDKII